MAKFRCKLSGTVVEFIYPVDIDTTRENPAYEEIEDGLQEKEQNPKKEVKKSNKKTAKVEE